MIRAIIKERQAQLIALIQKISLHLENAKNTDNALIALIQKNNCFIRHTVF